MRNATWKICLMLLLVEMLGGCAAAAIAGVAAGAAGAATVAADRRTAGTVVEDQAIELRAHDALVADPALQQQTHINVTSYNGRVLLSGEVPSETLRQTAAERVRGVEKVKSVFNELTVAQPSPLTSRSTDALLTTKVKTGLVANPDTSAFNVKVVTERGVVYLMGITKGDEGRRAIDVARQVDGVQKVVSLFEQTAAAEAAAPKHAG